MVIHALLDFGATQRGANWIRSNMLEPCILSFFINASVRNFEGCRQDVVNGRVALAALILTLIRLAGKKGVLFPSVIPVGRYIYVMSKDPSFIITVEAWFRYVILMAIILNDSELLINRMEKKFKTTPCLKHWHEWHPSGRPV